MSDLLVSSYQSGGSAGDVIPTDQVSINFSKIEIEYKEQKGDGSLGGATKAGWDLKKNMKV
jgi:type VI secretion system secreted protein Hcp